MLPHDLERVELKIKVHNFWGNKYGQFTSIGAIVMSLQTFNGILAHYEPHRCNS